jgi:hypothetical protein
MILTKDQLKQMAEASKPLMKFLSDFHPHVKVEVTAISAEFMESCAMEHNHEFIKD